MTHPNFYTAGGRPVLEDRIRQTPMHADAACGVCFAISRLYSNCIVLDLCRAAGFGNCDGNAANGCETHLNTPANCGGCGVVCTFPPNGAPVCEPSTLSCSFICNTGDAWGSDEPGCHLCMHCACTDVHRWLPARNRLSHVSGIPVSFCQDPVLNTSAPLPPLHRRSLRQHVLHWRRDLLQRHMRYAW